MFIGIERIVDCVFKILDFDWVLLLDYCVIIGKLFSFFGLGVG